MGPALAAGVSNSFRIRREHVIFFLLIDDGCLDDLGLIRRFSSRDMIMFCAWTWEAICVLYFLRTVWVFKK